MPHQSLESLIAIAVGTVLGRPAETFGPADGLDQTEGWDSLAHMSILLAVEQAIKQEFSADELLELRTFQQIIDKARGKFQRP
jgi:acyl carrier protein